MSKRYLPFGLAVLVFGVFILASPVHADSPADTILSGLGAILGAIIAFMGKLVIILVNILIQFAKYNDFVNAQPVKIGWVLMRDVANMFFIVVLLVSAFSTIIQYQEFHYSKVLPKLLLMAVLINFSKTLIGLLVDFSQVLMLTFVNAFAQAAGGNFITALKLTKITQLSRDPELTQKLAGDLIPAAILGIMMLGISMTILVIMIGFIVFRIVALWILLIISPMAFFAWSLPGKMAKALSAFTNKFWERLSTVLIGGPIMAFFLWLALAVVQGTEKPFGNIFSESDEVKGAAEFATQVGTAPDIASFIVVVALLLAGVEAAVSQASALSPTLGKYAGMAAAGGGVAVHLARGASKLGKTTMQYGGKAAKAGFEGVDRFADVRGMVGKAGLKVSGKYGGIGAGTFAGMAGHAAAKTREKQKKMDEITGSLDSATRAEFLRARSTAWDPRTAAAAQMSLADDAKTGVGLKSRTEVFKQQLAGRTDLDTTQRQAMAEAMAAEQAGRELKSGLDTAQRLGDDGKFTAYGEAIKKNATLNADWGSFGGIKNTPVDDPKKYLGEVPTSDYKDSRAAFARMSALGLIDENGNEVRTEENKEIWDKLMKGGRGKLIQEHLDTNKTSVEQRVAILKAMDGQADENELKTAEEARRFATIDNGRVGSIRLVDIVGPPTSANIEQKFTIRNEQQINQGKERLRTMAAANVKGDSTDAVAVKGEMLAAGAKITEAFKFKEGVFENDENRNAYHQVMRQMNAGLESGNGSAMEALARFDVNILSENPGHYNEARSAAIASLTPEALKSGFKEAVKSGNREAQQNIQKILAVTQREAERSRGISGGAGVSITEVRAAATGAEGGEAALDRIEQAGGVTRPQAFQMAKAESLAASIQTDPELRLMQKGLNARASRAAQKGEAAVVAAGRRAEQAATAVGGAMREGVEAGEGAAASARGAVNRHRNRRGGPAV